MQPLNSGICNASVIGVRLPPDHRLTHQWISQTIILDHRIGIETISQMLLQHFQGIQITGTNGMKCDCFFITRYPERIFDNTGRVVPGSLEKTILSSIRIWKAPILFNHTLDDIGCRRNKLPPPHKYASSFDSSFRSFHYIPHLSLIRAYTITPSKMSAKRNSTPKK